MMSRVVFWVLSAVFPPADGVPGIGDFPDGLPRVQQMLGESPLSFRAVVWLATLLFMVSPLMTIGWPLPAFLLPRAKLDHHAHALASSRIYLVRQANLMLKTVGGMLWGGHPMVRENLGLVAYSDDPGTFRTGGESWQALQKAGEQLP